MLAIIVLLAMAPLAIAVYGVLGNVGFIVADKIKNPKPALPEFVVRYHEKKGTHHAKS